MSAYTEEQIRAAFWKTFHKRGELWFGYFDDTPEGDERCTEDTESFWDEFRDNLVSPESDG